MRRAATQSACLVDKPFAQRPSRRSSHSTSVPRRGLRELVQLGRGFGRQMHVHISSLTLLPPFGRLRDYAASPDRNGVGGPVVGEAKSLSLNAEYRNSADML